MDHFENWFDQALAVSGDVVGADLAVKVLLNKKEELKQEWIKAEEDKNPKQETLNF